MTQKDPFIRLLETVLTNLQNKVEKHEALKPLQIITLEKNHVLHKDPELKLRMNQLYHLLNQMGYNPNTNKFEAEMAPKVIFKKLHYLYEQTKQANHDVAMLDTPTTKKKIAKHFNDVRVYLEKFGYKLQQQIGKGTYGEVFEGFDIKRNNHKVAIKSMNDVFDIYESYDEQKKVFREFLILRHLRNHNNIISLYDVISPSDYENFKDMYYVMEIMDCDLDNIIRSKQVLSEKHIKWFMYQLINGLHYMHSAGIIHRDLKPHNILVNSNCDLKICDFGLSRAVQYDTNPQLSTVYLVTRWYRAPELLLEYPEADSALDIWAAGCIMAELIGRQPLFPGKNRILQINEIVKILGNPAEEDLYGSKYGIQYTQQIEPTKGKPFEELFPNMSPECIDFLRKMLIWSPKKRITAAQALAHPFFAEYRQPEFEYTCKTFDFAFEEKIADRSNCNIKRLMYDEIVNSKNGGGFK